MKALILVNGDLTYPEVLRRRVGAAVFDLIIAVDGGTRHAHNLGVTPDAIVGDLDSLPESERQSARKTEFVSFPVEKNETDLELALLYARDKGASGMVIVGATGGRLEMTITNIMVLAQPALTPFHLELWDGEQTASLIRPPGAVFAGQAGDTLSLIPLAGAASGITTRGLRYPLKNETLSPGPARGVSNRLTRKSARIALKTGLLLAVFTPQSGAAGPKNPGESPKTLNVGVQVLPLVPDVYAVVDQAIAVIQASGVKYEVGPLETTLEGDNLDRLIEVAKSAHRACFAAGAGRVVTLIKIAEAVEGTSIEQKVAKYRRAAR
jgi:thiamine pyrophosphokinase